MSSPTVFLAPCSSDRPQKHLQETVLTGVPIEKYSQYTSAHFGDSVAIWGVSPGTEPTWENISEGDYLLFYLGDRKYRYAASVLDTERNPDLSMEIWPDYGTKAAGGADTTDPWECVIYLDDPFGIDINSEEIHSFAGHTRKYPFNFIPLNDKGHTSIRDEFGSIREYLRAKSRDPAPNTVQPDESESTPDIVAPKRTQVTTSRVVRNTELVNELKKEYSYECQVCGDQRQRSSGEGYAEGHHLKPLGNPHNGPDSKENILVLCPNHHADFDYGMIAIDPDTFEIDHQYDSTGIRSHLKCSVDHKPAHRFIEYHNNKIYSR